MGSFLDTLTGRLFGAPTDGAPETRRALRPGAETRRIAGGRPAVDDAWRRGLVAAAQLGEKARAIDVELDWEADGLRSVRLFDRGRDPSGLPAALRALDGLCAEVRRVRVTLASSALAVVVFERRARPADPRRAA